MRLTLRTMLAYLDDVLDPADAVALKKKIEESDFASGLVDRIRGVLKKLRMDAPKLDGKGMGNDANTVAEYLDSALTQDRVAEFERVCLESDKHLCEVASCHQILTIVLGKPADVPLELREQVYGLADPNRAPAHAVAGPATDHAAKVAPPPVSSTNGRPATHAAPLEVPEYLRAGRQSSLWPFVAIAAAALVVTTAVLWKMGSLDDIFRGGQTVALNTDDQRGEKSNGQTPLPDDSTPPVLPSADVPPSSASPPIENVATADAKPPVTPLPPNAIEPPPTESPDRIAATVPAPVTPLPIIPDPADTAVPPAPAPINTAPAVAVTPKLPKAKGPIIAEPAKPVDVGRYTSDGLLFATLDPNDGLWYIKQSQETLTAGEHLVVLPPYRPQIALPSAVQLTFAGEGSLKMEEPDENRTPRVAIEYGRFLAATAGKAGAQVWLDLHGTKGLLTLVDADSVLAIKVARWLPPGVDPEVEDAASVVVEMYNANGRATWQPVDQPKVEIPARFVHVVYNNDPPETHGPFFSPEWIDGRSVKPIDRDTAVLLEKLVVVDLDRPLNLSLQEVMKDRRVEVRALTARCLAALGDYEPVLRELADPNQYSYWQGEVDALRHAMSRSPEVAAKVRESVNLLRAANASDLYRMLWGYSEDQLSKGASGQLIKFLEHEQMDVRVLAYVNLVSITGVFGFYRPERPPVQMKTAIADWTKRKDKGAIIYKLPPSPLDTYKPIGPPAAADAKGGGGAAK